MKEPDITESLWQIENAIGAGFRNVEGMLAFAAIGYLIRDMTGAAVGILVGGFLVECWQRAIDARRGTAPPRRKASAYRPRAMHLPRGIVGE
jgi:hypothetical protein